MTGLTWRKIKIDPRELSINKVLKCGQLFRWHQINNVWSCCLYNRVIFLKQDSTHLHYALLFKQLPKIDDTEHIINDYFQLHVNLTDLYKYWNSIDKNFTKSSTKFNGIRMLRQDPWENLISFICSTNNNVKRISKMCNSLCEQFGQYLLTHDGIDYFEFPQPKALSDITVEGKLRALGFGYRAKYIQKTSQMIYESNFDMMKLRSLPYQDCFEQLIKFQGVGPKVADCVCLMSLDKHDIVPVDTHVFTFAKRDYKFKNSSKTLNKQLYEDIRQFFKLLWGEYAGWAHSVLFAADLKDLSSSTTTKKGVVVHQIPKIPLEEVFKREEIVGLDGDESKQHQHFDDDDTKVKQEQV